MPRNAGRVLVALVVGALSPVPSEAGGRTHDKEFWREVARNDYRVPEGESAAALVHELSARLGSPDPEWRDEFAYRATVAWIYRDKRLSRAEVGALMDEWVGNLKVALGETGTDSVLLRSFSALDLSVIAALDVNQPVLSDTDFRRLVSAALAYMDGERDLRGYEPEKGWFHATAHTADLLKFLGRSPRLPVADQGRILDAIAGKLGGGGKVFVFGENERMAAAVRSLVLRPDLDHERFGSWLAQFPRRNTALWEQPRPDMNEFAAVQNAKELLRSLFVQLAAGDRLEPGAEGAKAKVLECLKSLG